jgi:hypothetical protein
LASNYLKKLDKKGQFYIFVAVLFCALALTLVTSNFGTRGYKVVYENVKNNFVAESNYVVNSALSNNENVTDNFLDFSQYFLNYSKTKNINFRILYFLVDKDVLYINNMLDFAVNVTADNSWQIINSSSAVEIPKPDYVDVKIDDYTTRIELTNETTQLKMYFRLGVLK